MIYYIFVYGKADIPVEATILRDRDLDDFDLEYESPPHAIFKVEDGKPSAIDPDAFWRELRENREAEAKARHEARYP